MKQPTEPIPHFASETQERAFWESRDSSDCVDWRLAQFVVLPNLKPTAKANALAPEPATGRTGLAPSPSGRGLG